MPRITTNRFCSKRVITEVQKLPVLWDPSHEKYPSYDIRRLAWRTVCASIHKNFYLMDVVKQKALLKELKKTWRVIRTQHRIGYEEWARNRREPSTTRNDNLEFLVPTYGCTTNKYNETNLENSQENDNSTLKEYIVIEVKEELSENESVTEIKEIKSENNYLQDIGIAQINEEVFDNSTVANKATIKAEMSSDSEMDVSDTSQDAVTNDEQTDISVEESEATTNKEVFDHKLEIGESVIKKEIIDEVELGSGGSFEDFENSLLGDNDTFFAFLESSMNALSSAQKLNFRIQALQLLERIKNSESVV